MHCLMADIIIISLKLTLCLNTWKQLNLFNWFESHASDNNSLQKKKR
jgi:hypothetical protein